MSKSVIVLCCLLAVAVAVRDPEWEIFKSKFNRRYKSPTEETFRKKIFLNNKLAINQQNQRYAEGQSTFTMGINQFTDMTTLEFNQMVNSYKDPSSRSQNPVSFAATNVAIPTSVDWRSTGCVAPVKDQGQCGACWAFSSIASVEYHNCIAKSNVLTRLSEQSLVDCTYKYGNNGCNGGWMTPCFQYIIDNKGVGSEATYPYEAVSKKNRCRYNAANNGATLSSFAEIVPYNSESALTNAIGSVGAVSVAINAGLQSFQSYKSGVYDDAACTATLNHAVLAVGYGDEGGVPYFLVKNSWGTAWGDNGYIKMSRNGNNQCGIASRASYPIV